MATWSQFYLTLAKQMTNLPSKNQALRKLSYCKSIAIVINQSLDSVTKEDHKWPKSSMIVTGYSLTWWKLNKACDHVLIAVYQLMNLGYAFKTSNYSFWKFFYFDLLFLLMFYNKSMHWCYMNHSILLIKHKMYQLAITQCAIILY